MRTGDPVKVGARGLSQGREVVAEGRIVKVYPELQGGRVVADAEVKGLGGYFVGERALVWISAGKRRTIVVPAAYVFSRFGLDFVRLAQAKDEPAEICQRFRARECEAVAVAASRTWRCNA